ncbi:MAG: hypothetical protein RQ875_02700 [Vicingaceae bacterium]|nr:hypothetical protein [Vicingaceae bacterium]
MYGKKINSFRKKYKHLEKFGLEIGGIAELMGTYVIAVSHPLIFDNRWLSKKFEGIDIRSSTSGELPKEFVVDQSDMFWYEKYYVWAPERFEKFVDRCGDEIREKLKNPTMTRDDMLDALCFGDFKKHKKLVEENIKSGKLPEYTE